MADNQLSTYELVFTIVARVHNRHWNLSCAVIVDFIKFEELTLSTRFRLLI